MAHFSHFPNEIISEIWGNVLEPEGVESFALVSKLVYAVGRPFVEEHNKLKRRYSYFELNTEDPGVVRVKMLKKILLWPRVALYVTHLSISTYWTDWTDYEDTNDGDPHNPVPHLEHIMGLCIEAIGKLGFVPPNQISRRIEKIRNGDADPIRAFLFLLLPNITTLTVVNDGAINGDLWEATIQRITEAEKPTFLTRLITVNIECQRGAGGNLHLLKTFAALPLVQNLYVSCMEPESEDYVHFTSGSSKITNMTFKRCAIQSKFLFQFLESNRGLKTFNYMEPNENSCQFEPFWIRAALLANAKHSLESLIMLSRKTQGDEELGTFREFTALKELETNVRLLMYWTTTVPFCKFADLLPASIENLYLHARDSSSGEKVPILVEEIVKTKSQLIPKLRELKFKLKPENALLQGPESLMESLEEKCREVGLDLIIAT